MNNSSKPQTDRTSCQGVVEQESACADPLKIKAGQELTASDRESDWSGRVWCTDGAGKGGWVPETRSEHRQQWYGTLRL